MQLPDQKELAIDICCKQNSASLGCVDSMIYAGLRENTDITKKWNIYKIGKLKIINCDKYDKTELSHCVTFQKQKVVVYEADPPGLFIQLQQSIEWKWSLNL